MRSLLVQALVRARSFISAIAAQGPAWGLDPRAAQGEGSVRRSRSMHQGPLTLTLSPSSVSQQPDFVAVHIPVRGSFIHVAPR
jgi:hypothetical protein